jgi:hypothetical protein
MSLISWNIIPFRSKKDEIERVITEAVHGRKSKTWLKAEDLLPALTTAWCELPDGSSYEHAEYKCVKVELVYDARDAVHGFIAENKGKTITSIQTWSELWSIENAYDIVMIGCKDGPIECPRPIENKRVVSKRLLMEELV